MLRHLTAVRTLAATSLLATMVWAGGAAVTAAPAAAAAKKAGQITIGTYNIRAGVGVGGFRDGVSALTQRVDVAGLQEVNSHEKEDVLAGLSGWGYFRSLYQHGEQTPVIWNQSEYRFVSARSPRISPRTFIGNELPGHLPYAEAAYVTVVRLEHRASGKEISLVNVHLIPGAVMSGAPVPGRAKVFKLFKHQVARVAEVAGKEKHLRPVFVLGDFNIGWVADMKHARAGMPYRKLKAVGLRSMWATERPSTTRGTHSKSLIDQVYSASAATAAKVQFDMSGSDHYPAVASYRAPSMY